MKTAGRLILIGIALPLWGLFAFCACISLMVPFTFGKLFGFTNRTYWELVRDCADGTLFL